MSNFIPGTSAAVRSSWVALVVAAIGTRTHAVAVVPFPHAARLLARLQVLRISVGDAVRKRYYPSSEPFQALS